jgi:hypothetical protein
MSFVFCVVYWTAVKIEAIHSSQTLIATRLHGASSQTALFVITVFFFCDAAGLGLLILEISRSHTTHTTICRTSLDE